MKKEQTVMLKNIKWETIFYSLALLSGAEKVNAINETLSQFRNPKNLKEMLAEYEESIRNSVHEITECYTHDNGFDKLVLFEDEQTKMKFRLHLWHRSNTDRIRQNVHNHRWDFSSLVLTGEVTQLIYEVSSSEDGELFHKNRYFARGHKEHYTVESLGQERLLCVDKQSVTQNSIYSTPNEALHRVDVPNDLVVATLIITHENVGWVVNDLYSEFEFTDKSVIASPPFSKDEVIQRLQILKEVLELPA